jgi:NodT family efflux transporter outer membrane factor (OMF) lipoprotein
MSSSRFFRSRWLLSIACVTLISGCAVGPNYTLPTTAAFNDKDAQGAFIGTRNSANVRATSLPAGWWRLYQSDTLNRLVEAGFDANTDLRVAQANLQRSEAMVRQAAAQGQPQLGFDGGYERALLSAESYLSPAEDLPPMNLYSLSLSASYEVDLFGRIKRGEEAAKDNQQAVEAARDWVRVTVAANITRSYLQVCSDGEELAVANRSVDLQKRSLAYTQSLQTLGRATNLDVARSRALVDQISSAIPVIEANRQNALFQLAVLTGKPPEDFDASLMQCTSAPPLSDPIPVGDGAALLSRRPDIRAAERQLAAATAQIGVETADLYPRIVLKASIGSIGTATDFLEHATNAWSIGPFVSWQLNQSAARARIGAANASQQAQLARFDGTVLGALRDVETALSNYNHDLDREKTLTAARDEAAKAASYSHQLQAVGRSSELATLDAERTLAGADSALAGGQARVSQDQVALFLALGGGWEARCLLVCDMGR